LFFRGCHFIFKSRRNYGLEEWHHRAKFGAKLLDGVVLFALASCQEIGTTFFIFFHPGLCETAVADLREDFAHLLARLLGDDAWPCGVIALFGSVAYGIAHIAEAAAVDQVNDELEFVETFEIGNLRL